MAAGALTRSVEVGSRCEVAAVAEGEAPRGLLDMGLDGGTQWLGELKSSTAGKRRRADAVRGHLAGPPVGTAVVSPAVHARYAMGWDGQHWLPRRGGGGGGGGQARGGAVRRGNAPKPNDVRANGRR